MTLQNKVISDVYLLLGSEEWLREEAIRRIEAELDIAAIDRSRVEPGKTPLVEALDQARIAPFQSRRRLVVIDGIAKLPVAEQEALVAYCRQPAQTGVVAIACAAETLPAWLRPVQAQLTEVACHPLVPARLPIWLQDRAAQRLGKTLDRAAAMALIERVGTSLRPLAQVLEQMACFVGAQKMMTVRDVMQLVGAVAAEETFAMTRALGRGDLAGALERLNRLLDQGDEPEQLIGLLRWHWEKLNRDRRGFRILLATDLAIKRGRVAPRIALEEALVRLARATSSAPPRAPAAVS